jgi:hypothetical protein
LLTRDLDGNPSNGPEAFYDTVLNVTWLRTVPLGTGSWDSYQAWAANLNFGGITDWRLPRTVDAGVPYYTGPYSYGGPGANIGFNVDPSISELAHLFFITLGNKATYDIFGNSQINIRGWTNTGDFLNLGGKSLWLENAYSLDSTSYWYFKGTEGYQNVQYQFNSGIGAIALHAGDVGVSLVPEPTSAATMLSGLLIGAFAITRGKLGRQPKAGAA